jgi:hypothetical protein
MALSRQRLVEDTVNRDKSSPQDYKYTPLPDNDWIRLLQIEAQSDVDNFTVSLKVIRLDENVIPYTTLSYTWGRNSDGDASLSRTLLLDNGVICITENLRDCLGRVQPQHGEQPLLLWVDAVCINQNDIAERNSQVAMMADIYRKASALIIWLGEGHDSDEDGRAFHALMSTQGWEANRSSEFNAELLKLMNPKTLGLPVSTSGYLKYSLGVVFAKRWSSRTLSESYQEDIELPWHSLKLFKMIFGKALNDVDPSNSTGRYQRNALFKAAHERRSPLWDSVGPQLLAQISDTIAALAPLCARRYFRRRWILQEIYNSSKIYNRNFTSVTVRWGPFSMDSVLFTMSFRRLENLVNNYCSSRKNQSAKHVRLSLSKAHQHAFDICNAAVSTFRMQQAYGVAPSVWKPKSIRMLHWMRVYRDSECSDDRDRIFALLNMGKMVSSLVPDYHLAADQVYIDFACYIIEQGGLRVVLELAASQHSISGCNRSAGLPSWVPDLRCPLTAPPPPHLDVFWTAKKDVELSDSKRILTCSEQIGDITNSLRADHSSPYHEGEDFICWLNPRPEHSRGCILRRVPSEDNCFTIVHDLDTETRLHGNPIENFVTNIGMRTIRVC